MDAITKDADVTHKWRGPTETVRWEYCADCLVIRRADRQNKPCKGKVKVALR